MSYQLKCKAIALAVEAQAFKKQEQRQTRLARKWKERAAAGKTKAEKFVSYQPGIRNHRVFEIRKEARNALLAYGFVRGLSYVEMENFAWTQPNWDRVEKLAVRYSDKTEQEVKQSFAQWRDVALNGVQPKWCETLVPGSVKDANFDMDWVNMQIHRNAGKPAPALRPRKLPEGREWAEKQTQTTSLLEMVKGIFI